MRGWLLVFALALVSAPASAEVQFYAFSGAEHLQRGEGGLNIRKSGVDFWTEGYPAQQYKILGLIRDRGECTLPLKRDIGYSKVAKAALKAGANAVILLPASARSVDLAASIPEHLTAEEALARAGIRTMGNNVALAPEALTYRKPELAIGDQACGELRFVAIKYLAGAGS